MHANPVFISKGTGLFTGELARMLRLTRASKQKLDPGPLKPDHLSGTEAIPECHPARPHEIQVEYGGILGKTDHLSSLSEENNLGDAAENSHVFAVAFVVTSLFFVFVFPDAVVERNGVYSKQEKQELSVNIPICFRNHP